MSETSRLGRDVFNKDEVQWGIGAANFGFALLATLASYPDIAPGGFLVRSW